MRFRVWGLGFKFRIRGHSSGFRVLCLVFRVSGFSKKDVCAEIQAPRGRRQHPRTTIEIMFCEKVAPATIRRWTPPSSAVFFLVLETPGVCFIRRRNAALAFSMKCPGSHELMCQSSVDCNHVLIFVHAQNGENSRDESLMVPPFSPSGVERFV